MNDSEPAVVDDIGPSPAPGQSTQHDEPLGVTRIRRYLEERGASRLEIEEAIQRAYRAYGEELASAPTTEKLHFEMPPPGIDLTLSLPQLRWCLREDRLVESYRPNVMSEWDQDAFDRVVDRYNDRCGSFRYRQRDLERARRDVGGR
jgi:sirohydrochlorin ferrochelatase